MILGKTPSVPLKGEAMGKMLCINFAALLVCCWSLRRRYLEKEEARA